MNLPQLVGILPAVIFPAATFLQLFRMVRGRTAAGVNAATWLMFGFANLALYVYTERYTEWQAITGLLATALLDFVIVGYVWFAPRQPAA